MRVLAIIERSTAPSFPLRVCSTREGALAKRGQAFQNDLRKYSGLGVPMSVEEHHSRAMPELEVRSAGEAARARVGCLRA